MKVRVLENAWYDLKYLKAGDIIDYKCEKGKNLPSWATLADGIETKKGNKKADKDIKDVPSIDAKELDNVGQKDADTNETPVKPDENKNDGLDNVGQDAPEDKTEIEKAEYLDELINEGIEKGILIEDADKKSVDEQIAELEKALNK